MGWEGGSLGGEGEKGGLSKGGRDGRKVTGWD